MAKSVAAAQTIEVAAIEKEQIEVCILGTTPFLANRQSEKVRGSLVFPPVDKTRATRSQTLKHNPIEEFRASPYTLDDGRAPTLIGALAVWFKKGMMLAAMETGAKKAQIGRVLRVEGERIPLWGVPKLHMASVRQAGINGAPDIRTRAVLEEWATVVTVTFPKRILKAQAILNLLHAAGVFSGIGDWRTEKGSGNFGSYEIVNDDHPDWKRITKEQGRAAQQKAMDTPVCYDDETEALLEHWRTSAKDRGFEVAA